MEHASISALTIKTAAGAGRAVPPIRHVLTEAVFPLLNPQMRDISSSVVQIASIALYGKMLNMHNSSPRPVSSWISACICQEI